MTYAQATAGAQDLTWRDRVQAALFEACVAITQDVPNAGVDTRRDILARKILAGTTNLRFLENFALAVALGFLAEADLSANNVSDAEIAGRVSAVFNDFVSGHFGG